MHEPGRRGRPSAPWTPDEFTVKKIVLRALKQIMFILAIGLVLWGVHALTHSPANAHTSHPSANIKASDEAATESPARPAPAPAAGGHNLSTRSKP